MVKEYAMIKTIPRSIKSDLIDYRKLLRSNGINITKIILFGSIAKGKSDKFSDIDVAIVSPSFGKNYRREMVKLTILSSQINDNIEPHPFNPAELNNKFNALANEIKKYGLVIK